jgi:hypothetical protein
LGQPVAHFEFWSEDPARLAEFYAKAFDWNIENIEEIKYHLIESGGEGGIGGGIMTPQKGPWPRRSASRRRAGRSWWSARTFQTWAHSLCSRIPTRGCWASGSKGRRAASRCTSTPTT